MVGEPSAIPTATRSTTISLERTLRLWEELLVMMQYLVSHNDAHAQEVAGLARELMAAGVDVAYDKIMDAVADFDMVSAKLAAVLSKLTAERF